MVKPMKRITGMNPKQALETDSAASCGVLNPPLRGIVQLTNSAAPIVTFRLFAFVIGVSTIKRAQ
jgi:hypothetical protein